MSNPSIVRRAGWGAAAPSGGYSSWPTAEPTGHTGHWEGSGGHVDHAFCAAEVRSIQRFHLSTGYIDIAYNWIVCIHGVIFEGRPISVRSAAQRDGNAHRVAICFMWGSSYHLNDAPAARAAASWLIHTYDPPSTRHRCIGHRDEPSCSTFCPGNEAEAWIKSGAYGPVGTPVPQPAPAPSPLPQGGVHHPVLRRGNVGPAVMELQRKINSFAGTHLALDGDFGPRTDLAVRNVQRFFKLEVDGIAGPKTWGIVDYCAALHGVR